MILFVSSCLYSSGHDARVCGTVGEGVLILLLNSILGPVLSSSVVFSFKLKDRAENITVILFIPTMHVDDFLVTFQ